MFTPWLSEPRGALSVQESTLEFNCHTIKLMGVNVLGIEEHEVGVALPPRCTWCCKISPCRTIIRPNDSHEIHTHKCECKKKSADHANCGVVAQPSVRLRWSVRLGYK